MTRRPQSNFARAVATLVLLTTILVAWRAGALSGPVEELVRDAANSGLSQRDVETATQNYYEVLTDVDRSKWTRGGLARIGGRLLKRDIGGEDNGNWRNIRLSGLVEPTDDPFFEYELVPGIEKIFMGATVRTNRWRMRDHDYEPLRAEGTFRIALIGASNTMGYGVEQDEVFSEILERRLNDELAGGKWQRYEVLNFSVGGYQMLDRLYVLDQRIPRFDPQLVLVCATMHDLRWAIHQRMVRQIRDGKPLHFAFLEEIAREAGVEQGQSETRMAQKLKQRRAILAAGCFEEVVRIANREGFTAAVLNLRIRVDPIHPEMIQQSELSRKAGLITLELFDAYEGQKDTVMYLLPSDPHPTALAHRRLADELWNDMMSEPALREMLVGSGERSGSKENP